MNFEEALRMIKDGWFVSRPSWNNLSIGLFKPEWYSAIKTPFIFVDLGDDLIPWTAGHDDLLAEDFFTTEFRN